MDPNTAEWFELAQLPGIGPSLSRRVVAYREQTLVGRGDGRTVFKRSADLCGVRGLGLKKVERIGRFLRFPSVPDRS